MAIDKKLIHFKTWNKFIEQIGGEANVTKPTSGEEEDGTALYGQIKGTSIVFIKDVGKIWTHGNLYGENEIVIDDVLSDTSENPVKGNVIKEYVDLHPQYESVDEIDVPELDLPMVECDSELSTTSIKPVYNRVITQALNNKVDKVSGKQLSTEDFTTALKTKLEGLTNYDDAAIQNAVSGLTTQLNTLVNGDASTAIESFNEITAFLANVTDEESLEGIVAGIEQQISTKQDKINDLDTIRSGAAKGATAIQKVKTINGEEIVGEGNIEINVDTPTLATKGELEDLAEEIASNERVWAEALNDLNERINEIGTGGGGGGGTSDIVVDAALSTTSTNAIQNKAVANALNEKADASALANKQDTLVSGTNIKTVQGQSILGSGNISISVPTVDAELSSTSTNAVQNKVVTEMLAALGGYSDFAGYIRAYTDADGRFLWGIKEDGSIEWSKGVPAPVIEFIEPKITEVTQSISDLSQSFSAMMEEVSSVSEKINEIGEYAADTEYIRKYVDENDVFLWGIKEDGSIEWGKGVPTPVQEFVAEQVAVIMNKFDIYEALFNTLSHDIKQLNNIVSYKADGRWIYAIAGEDNRVVLGIDANGNICGQGFKVEEKIHFSESAMTELQKDLRTSGFQVDSPIDWSSESSITLPIPRACAKVNIISSSGLATSKTEDKVCQLEYYDKDGNYFKKYIVLNAQGSSSMAYIEKNQSIDVFNDEACEESCEITFGNWVTQDSFHLKCYYIDVFRGIANIAYNFSEEVIQYVGSRNNRIIFDTDAINTSNSTGDFDTDFGDGALCHPDGFPFEMYVNGEYYGLFAWNLKKHRKNYSMSKNSYNQILLDGKIGADELFGGVIDWTAFELRNPKDLVTMDGKKYDADTNCNELIDSSSSVYDPSNQVHVKTAECKSLIIRQSNAIAAISGESNESLARELFETYYDKTAMMVYTIVSNVFYHLDGFWKNWIWTIYDNIAAPSFYDLDSIFGRNTRGTGVEANSLINVVLGTDNRYPTGQLFRLYKTELDEMYADLRKNNIISVDNIMGYVSDWTARVGRSAYERNIKEWPSIPSYRSQKTEEDGTTDTGGMFDSPIRVRKWLENRLVNLDQYFNYQSNY